MGLKAAVKTIFRLSSPNLEQQDPADELAVAGNPQASGVPSGLPVTGVSDRSRIILLNAIPIAAAAVADCSFRVWPASNMPTDFPRTTLHLIWVRLLIVRSFTFKCQSVHLRSQRQSSASGLRTGWDRQRNSAAVCQFLSRALAAMSVDGGSNYSITSSARAISEGGTVRPSDGNGYG
jgi:hypothetical protein